MALKWILSISWFPVHTYSLSRLLYFVHQRGELVRIPLKICFSFIKTDRVYIDEMPESNSLIIMYNFVYIKATRDNNLDNKS